jgi:hypothetical protein
MIVQVRIGAVEHAGWPQPCHGAMLLCTEKTEDNQGHGAGRHGRLLKSVIM